MVWYGGGVVWYGRVGCGMVWYGVVWYGKVSNTYARGQQWYAMHGTLFGAIVLCCLVLW